MSESATPSRSAITSIGSGAQISSTASIDLTRGGDAVEQRHGPLAHPVLQRRDPSDGEARRRQAAVVPVGRRVEVEQRVAAGRLPEAVDQQHAVAGLEPVRVLRDLRPPPRGGSPPRTARPRTRPTRPDLRPGGRRGPGAGRRTRTPGRPGSSATAEPDTRVMSRTVAASAERRGAASAETERLDDLVPGRSATELGCWTSSTSCAVHVAVTGSPIAQPATPRGQRARVRCPWNPKASSATGTLVTGRVEDPGGQPVQAGRGHHEHGAAEPLGRRTQRHLDRRCSGEARREGGRHGLAPLDVAQEAQASRATGRAASTGRRGARAAGGPPPPRSPPAVAGPRRTASPAGPITPRRVGRTPSGWGTGPRRWPGPAGPSERPRRGGRPRRRRAARAPRPSVDP